MPIFLKAFFGLVFFCKIWAVNLLLYFKKKRKIVFQTFSACVWIQIIFWNLNSNCSNSSNLRNLQEQAFFWPLTVRTNFSSDCKVFANSCPSDSISKVFLDHKNNFFLTVGQNNFGNKIPGLKFEVLTF